MSAQSDTDQPSSWKTRTRRWCARCWEKAQSIAIEIFAIVIILLGGLLMLTGFYLEPGLEPCKHNALCRFLGTTDKKEAMYLLGLAIVFMASMCGLCIANRRAKAMEDSAQAQADAVQAQADAAQAQAQAVKATESGNLQQRFKDAIEHLGSASESVRIGGAHTLFHMALEAETLRESIADILCAHIRSTTQCEEYQKSYLEGPSIEIQSLMALLFVERIRSTAYSRKEQVRKFWRGLQADLSGGYFNGIALNYAQFRDAHLLNAQFLGAYLRCAQFQSSNISIAQFQMAHLPSACFQGAKLIDTKFWNAGLVGAQFQAAYLDGTHFQGANLESVQFQGGFDDDQELAMESFETRVNNRIGKNAELSEVIFAGGVDSKELGKVEGKLTDLKTVKTRKKRSDEAMNDFKEEMCQHGGPADHTVPEEIPDANVGAYTKTDARRWIAEYKKLGATG